MCIRVACLSLALAAAVLLAACTRAASPAQATPSPDPTPEPTPAATPAPSPTPTPDPAAVALVPDGDTVLAYDEIRTISDYGAEPRLPCEGYFTMSKDGRWGLLRADGTEVLPCYALEPVSRCGAGEHWIWQSEDPMTWESFDALSDRLTEAGDGALCPGHGGASDSFFYDLDSPGRDTHALDLSALRWYYRSTPGDVNEMKESFWEQYGGILPVYSAHEEGEEGDPKFPGDPVPDETGALWWYICQDGSALLIPGALQAGWFLDEALAPVQLEDGWAYVDRSGNLVTDAVYSATWGEMGEYANPDDPAAPQYAACLQNGYAAVCRDGQWGLLDSTGAEVVPCEHPGLAWDGTALWIKADEGWQRMALSA